jgi:hypothetical protein
MGKRLGMDHTVHACTRSHVLFTAFESREFDDHDDIEFLPPRVLSQPYRSLMTALPSHDEFHKNSPLISVPALR